MTTRSEKIMARKERELRKVIALAYRIGMADAKKEPDQRFLNLETLDTWEETLHKAVIEALGN